MISAPAGLGSKPVRALDVASTLVPTPPPHGADGFLRACPGCHGSVSSPIDCRVPRTSSSPRCALNKVRLLIQSQTTHGGGCGRLQPRKGESDSHSPGGAAGERAGAGRHPFPTANCHADSGCAPPPAPLRPLSFLRARSGQGLGAERSRPQRGAVAPRACPPFASCSSPSAPSPPLLPAGLFVPGNKPDLSSCHLTLIAPLL